MQSLPTRVAGCLAQLASRHAHILSLTFAGPDLDTTHAAKRRS
jgi:hypothetical protein